MPIRGEQERRRSSKRNVGGIKFYQQNQNDSIGDEDFSNGQNSNRAYFEGGDKDAKLESIEEINDESSKLERKKGVDAGFDRFQLESEEEPQKLESA